jgi:beta-N-acetylhexosaminidase
LKKIIKILAISSLFFGCSNADPMDKKIGSMLMVGFYGTEVSKESQICKDIRDYDLGGVILFDYNPTDRSKPKNISSKEQVARLTKQLQECSPNKDLLIAVDQEGGKVQRLKSAYGFYGNFPSASNVSKMSDIEISATYAKMAKELKSVGINYDLAPVVDLAINSQNSVIFGLGRSYGKNPAEVSKKAKLFVDAMNKEGILTSLKHFPGHGSSLGDTHKGYVDVTNTWNKIELEPYVALKNRSDSVMVAHVFNSKIDPSYPASLSNKTVNDLLRKKLGYNGVVITDDLQMGAIQSKYSLRDTLKLAINAGDDILLFGNQLDPHNTVKTKVLVETIRSLMRSNEILASDIDRAHTRVQKLKSKLR